MIGDGVCHALEEEQDASEQRRRFIEPRAIDLRGEIVLVEDEMLPEELEWGGQCPICVRWVASLDDVETFARGGTQHENVGFSPSSRRTPTRMRRARARPAAMRTSAL